MATVARAITLLSFVLGALQPSPAYASIIQRRQDIASDKPVCILGAGPSGLAAYLRLKVGYTVQNSRLQCFMIRCSNYTNKSRQSLLPSPLFRRGSLMLEKYPNLFRPLPLVRNRREESVM